MKKCDCYHTQTKRQYTYNPITGDPIGHDVDIGVCWGTKECEECSCGGDETKCDFYPEVRQKALKEQEPKFGKWISVKNNNPNKNGYYLCWIMVNKCGNKEEWRIDKLYWEDNLWLFHHNAFKVADNVTHWMPLPTPPEGE